MANMMIRQARNEDRNMILKFCKNTFSWGDYIEKVWDYWIDEGNLFVFEKDIPIGICHALFFPDQVWIEGIRIDSPFRRQKIASDLIRHVELVGKKENIHSSSMLIDTKNNASLAMAISLGYDIFQTWHFFSLFPKTTSNFESVHFPDSINLGLCSHYVDSWRWLSMDKNNFSSLSKHKKIISAKIDDMTSVAIMTNSKHFEKTLIVTLFSGSVQTNLQIISFLQNFAKGSKYDRIQILSNHRYLFSDSLEFKLSFHLMKKSLI